MRDQRHSGYDSLRESETGLRRSTTSAREEVSHGKSSSDYRAYPPLDKRAELSRSDLARDRYITPAIRQWMSLLPYS